jgi:hypothetical protein
VGDGRGMSITVAHLDLEVRCSGMVQCCIVYPSNRPDLGSEFATHLMHAFLVSFFKLMRVDEELNIFMCQEITVPCLIFCCCNFLTI